LDAFAIIQFLFIAPFIGDWVAKIEGPRVAKVGHVSTAEWLNNRLIAILIFIIIHSCFAKPVLLASVHFASASHLEFGHFSPSPPYEMVAKGGERRHPDSETPDESTPA
jgi:hypothetical protein